MLKYFLLLLFVATLLIKVSGLALCFNSANKTEYISDNEDTKEEKKIEIEYFDTNYFDSQSFKPIAQVENGVFFFNFSFNLSFFPEVLTPPPAEA